MPTQEEKLNKLKELLKMVDESITRKEFTDSFANVVKFVMEVKKKNEEEMDQLKAEYAQVIERAKEEITAFNFNEPKEKLNKLMAKVEDRVSDKLDEIAKEHSDSMDMMAKDMDYLKGYKDTIANMISEQERGMNFIRDKVRDLKNGDKGEPGKNGSPDTPDQILNKITGLLEIEDIKNLKETLEELKKIREERRIFGGGGFSKIAMDSRILDPYTPTGTIDGVNTDFTLTKIPNPSASLKVWRGGALQSLTEDYTLSGTTLTFLVAPVVGEIIKVEHRI